MSQIQVSRIALRAFAPVFLFLFTLTAPLTAAEYLKPGHPDSIALLPPPPMPGSEDYAADLASARAVFKARTPEQEARATKDATLTIFNFAPAVGDFFQPEKFPKTDKFFKDVKPAIRPVIDAVKNKWQRERPYQVDKDLTFGKPEASYSYPSGHSIVGTVQSLILAELFPDKREAILQIGRNIGWDRVLIGKHFPSDVHAGRTVAQAIFRELMKSPAFQRDLEEVKAEIKAHSQTASR